MKGIIQPLAWGLAVALILALASGVALELAVGNPAANAHAQTRSPDAVSPPNFDTGAHQYVSAHRGLA